MSEPSAYASLAAKLRGLDLTPAERAALVDVLARARAAEGPEVEGFGSLEFGIAGLKARGFKGSDEELQAMMHGRGFKGTDEELQTIVDWLGSLEAQE